MDLAPMMAALAYAELGWHVFPIYEITASGECACGAECDSPGKHPRTQHGLNDSTTDPAQIKAWWTRWPGSNVGIRTGSESEILVLDVDPKNGGEASLNRIAEHLGGLPPTRRVHTGGGGLHLYFRYPATRVGNSAGKLAPGIDIRGQGGYVVGAPSNHKSGGHYTEDADFDELCEFPTALLAKLTKPPEESGHARTTAPGGTTPYGQAALDGETARVANATDGTRNETLNRSSFKVGQLVASGEVARRDAEAFIMAAARAAGLPDAEVKAVFLRGVAAGAEHPRGRAPLSSNGVHRTPAQVTTRALDEWPEPIPLDHYDRPPFPVDALPPDLGAWAQAIAEAFQVPVDLPAMLCLSVLAGANAKKYEVEVRPGWREPLNLYCITAMPPGSRKSGVFTEATRIFYEYETERVEAEKSDHLREVANYEMLEKKVAHTNAQRAAAKDSTERNRAESSFQSAMKDFENTPEPAAETCLIGDDVTPERLLGVLAEQQERFAIFSAEGGLLQTIAGARYSKGASPSYDVLLKAHAGDPISHDRKSSKRVRCQHPALTMGLAVQPEILRGLASAPGAAGVGLLARFLYSVPDARVGYREIGAAGVPYDVTMNYRACLRRLLEAPLGKDPIILKMETYADEALLAFERELEPRLREDGDLGPMVEWASKAAGVVVRIAGNLALSYATEPLEYIHKDYVDCGIQIVRYLIQHARSALGVAGKLPEIDLAERIMAWTERRGLSGFSARDAFQAVKGTKAVSVIRQIQPALEILIDYGHIRLTQIDPEKRPGRPSSPYYDVRRQ